MKYKCDKCLKEFTQKSNFDVHMNRKKSCIKLFNDINTSLNTNNTQITHNATENHTNNTQITHKKSSNTNIIDDESLYKDNTQNQITNKQTFSSDYTITKLSFICKYCSKVFSRKDASTRHIKQYYDTLATKVRSFFLLLD